MLIVTLSIFRMSIARVRAPTSELESASGRTRALLITSMQRFASRSTANEPASLIHGGGPLILYEPSADHAMPQFEYPPNRRTEKSAYGVQYKGDRWLTDVQEVYRRFFGQGTMFARRGSTGFFVEAGAVQGTVYDSNSIFFERFLGWPMEKVSTSFGAHPSQPSFVMLE